MQVLKYDLNDYRVQYLIKTDKTLGQLIKHIGTSILEVEPDGFKCITKYIIGQQISDKARETIWQRVCATFGDITPNMMLSISESELRNVGLSNRKIEYIKTLAKGIVDQKLNFDGLVNLSNEEVVKELTAFKGIGRWTAEMYLIFSLGRENVLSTGDGTIRRTIQWMYSLQDLPSSKDLEEYFRDWHEYSSIVSSYLWKSIQLGLTQHPFDDIILQKECYLWN